MAGTYSELHKNIQDKFNESGVEIMSPHFTSVRDGNRTATPRDYLPRDYQPDLFEWTCPKSRSARNRKRE